MSPDYKKNLKHVEPEKKEVTTSEDDKQILEKYSGKAEPTLSPEEKTILEIISKRKTVDMITREINFALKPLGKELVTPEKVTRILKDLESRDLVKSVTGGDGNKYWVDTEYYREKLLGTEKL
ncbi:MAG: hypothetical protein HWN65_21910 [Candidatus Helarchaeota archaeon]|nr:hypothetical protein [Candidatus Helarchaeota archaeon]